MKQLFFDTETTGVPRNYKAPVSDVENWPRLVQLGYILYEDGNEVLSQEHVIKPIGFVISDEVSKIHGITHQYASECGEDLLPVLNYFSEKVRLSDEIVGHNMSYDMNVIGAELVRARMSEIFVGRSTYDTMIHGTNLCKIPGLRAGSYKWPKLSELHQFLFNTPLEQTHTALDDIRQTAKCYFEMKKRGVL